MWEAVSSRIGIEVATSDVEAFKRKFYAERAKARTEGCLEFDTLAVLMPPPDVTGKIWVVNNGQVQPKEQGGTGEEEPQTI